MRRISTARLTTSALLRRKVVFGLQSELEVRVLNRRFRCGYPDMMRGLSGRSSKMQWEMVEGRVAIWRCLSEFI